MKSNFLVRRADRAAMWKQFKAENGIRRLSPSWAIARPLFHLRPVIAHERVNLFWLILMAGASIMALTGQLVLPLLALVLFLGVHIGSHFVNGLRNICFGAGDRRRYEQAAQQQYEASILPNFIIQTKLMSPEDAYQTRSWIEEDDDKVVLHWLDHIEGMTEEEIAPRLMKQRRYFKAVRAEVREDDDMNLDIIFFKRDPLDQPHQIEQPMPLDLENMSVPIGVLSDGSIAKWTFKNRAASVVGGESGSGKTEALLAVLAAFAGKPRDIELHIIDNKGGKDWKNFQNLSHTYMTVDNRTTTIDDIYEFAQSLEKERDRRMDVMDDMFEEANFWEIPVAERRAQRFPFIFVLIDECQELFDLSNYNPRDPEDKEKIGKLSKITGIFTRLAKMGRSSGIHLMFVTQKPTADSIPTSIRNQASIRTALAVTESTAEEAILGPVGDAVIGIPRATSIPKSRPGGAVFVDEERNRNMGRFYYFHKDARKAYLDSIASTMSDDDLQSVLRLAA